MLTNQLGEFESLSAADRRQLGDVCDRFETALRAGQPARAEDFLGAAGLPARVLLRELLLIECEIRLRRGEAIDPAELASRFPGVGPLATEVVNLARRHADAGAPDGRRPSVAPLDRLGRFRIGNEIGRGGFGVVFLAEDAATGRPVALKVPHLPALLSPNLRGRFLREVEAAAGLDHPNLARVVEAGEDGLVCYLAVEYVPGLTLAAWMRALTFPPPSPVAARLAAALAGGLHHAHERGVLHCDLKPANVILADGDPDRPSVIDFGMARLVGGDADLSKTGLVAGTPAYMAPEQAAGRRTAVTARTDVYALGAVLYELLTGRPPHEGKSFVETLVQVHSAEVIRPRTLLPSVPAELEAVCLRCLEKDPARRYASAAELADDLGRYLVGEPTVARPAGWARRAWRHVRRRPALSAVTALLSAVGLSAAVAVTVFWRQAEAARVEAETAQAQTETSHRIAREVLDRLLDGDRFGPGGIPRTHKELALIAALRDRYRELLATRPGSLSDRRTLARIGVWTGEQQRLAGNTTAARDDLTQAIQDWQAVVRDPEAGPTDSFALGIAHYQLAGVSIHDYHHDEAIEHFRTALAYLTPAEHEGPTSPSVQYLAVVSTQLLIFLAGNGHMPEARAMAGTNRALLDRLIAAQPGDTAFRSLRVRAAIALDDESFIDGFLRNTADRQLADPEHLHTVGKLMLRRALRDPAGREAKQALAVLERAADWWDRLADQDPTNVLLVFNLASACRELRAGYAACSRTDEAVEAGRRGVRAWDRFPADSLLPNLQWFVQLRDLFALAEMDEGAVPRSEFRRLLAKRSEGLLRVTAEGTHDEATRSRLAGQCLLAAHHLRQADDLVRSRSLIEAGRRVFEQLARQQPEEAAWAAGLSEVWIQEAKVRWRGGLMDEVGAALRQSLEWQRSAARLTPPDPALLKSLDERLQQIISVSHFNGDVRTRLATGLADRHRRLAGWAAVGGRWAEAETSLREAEGVPHVDRVWTRQLAAAYRELAEDMNRPGPHRVGWLSVARVRCLAAAERLEAAAGSPRGP